MGELMMGVCGSFLAVELMGRGASPADAARDVLQRIAETYQLGERRPGGDHCDPAVGPMERRGARPGYHTAVRTSNRDELADPEHVLMP